MEKCSDKVRAAETAGEVVGDLHGPDAAGMAQRLSNADILDLFAFVRVGLPVIIR